MPRYMIVSADTADKVFRGGPIVADPGFDPGPGLVLLDEDTARTAGYTWPPPPPSVANTATLRERATAALAANATFLAIPSPTNAQNAAQVRTLTRECTALIRLLLDLTDTTDGA